MKIFAKSRTISLFVGLVLMILILPGVVSAYPTSSLNAQVISTTIPSSMTAGQTYPVSITMKNTGSMTWNEGSRILLGGVGDGSGAAAQFGPIRMSIPAGTNVLSGDQYTFTFRMTAPATPGYYTIKYRMVHEGYEWFGARATKSVNVVNQVADVPDSSETVTPATVTAGSPPKAQFTSNITTGKSPLFVKFTDQSTGTAPMTYKWDFSDGEGNLPENSQKNPVWRFWQEYGTVYTVSLTVTNAYGSSTITKQNYITLGTAVSAAPVAAFTSSVQSGTAPLTVQFTDQSANAPLTYAWDFNNDKKIDSTVKSPSFTYTNAGNYTVNLTVTNAKGKDSEIKTSYIKVSAPGTKPATTTPTITVTSPNGGETWVKGSTRTISWTSSGSVGSYVKIELLKAGAVVQTISSTTLNDGVFASWTVPSSLATGTDYRIRITSTTNTAIKDTSNNYFSLSAGTTPTPVPTVVVAKLPSAQFAANTTQGKSPLAVQFTDKSVSTGTTSYQWDMNNDGVVDYTAKNPVHTYKTAGTFTVKLTVTNASGSDSEVKTGYITASSLTVLTGSGSYGAESNPTGNPVGGGAGYTKIITGTDSRVKYTVSTKSELVSALKSAKSGEVVFVKGTAVIDMAGTPNTVIPAGVIVASDRGSGGSQGALIKYSSNSNGQYLTSMFIVGGNNVRITGLRLQGESLPQDGTGNGEASFLSAIKEQNKAGLEVDNCEIWGWAWAGVLAMDSTGTYVHHNYIHHNQARGEGYGAEVCGGDMLIEANIFNYNRHDISAAGRPGESYEARYNLVRGDGHPIGSHHFDVHACNPNNYNDDSEASSAFIAGNLYKIHHNTFEAGWQAPIGIRSRPVTGAYIYNNIFMSDSVDTAGGVPVWQRAYTFGNMFVTNNYWKGKLYTGDQIVWYYHP